MPQHHTTECNIRLMLFSHPKEKDNIIKLIHVNFIK